MVHHRRPRRFGLRASRCFAAALLVVTAAGAVRAEPAVDPSETLWMGTAVRTISPARGVPLMGYPSPRPNTGVSLELTARAAVFGTAERSAPGAALIILDLLHIDRSLGDAIRDRVAAMHPGLAREGILVSATHTHSGPSVSRRPPQEGPGDTEPAYFDAVVEAAADATATAWRDRSLVRLRTGRALARLGSNRRVVGEDGRATNLWNDPEGLHPGFFNPDIPFVVFAEVTTGAPKAVLLSYGCHPVVLGPKNSRVSADYPGYAVRELEAALPKSTGLFLTGAAGDINPRDCLYEDPGRPWAMGHDLATAVLEAIPQARPLKARPIKGVSTPLRLTLKRDYLQAYASRTTQGPDGPSVTSEVQVLRLGDLAFVSAPGELVSLLGVAVQNASPFPQTFIAYNSNDHLGYLVSDAIRREGGYEAKAAVAERIEAPYLAAAREALSKAREAR